MGNGPFITELFDEVGDKMCDVGKEFGSTTGRKRRCGWLNLDELKEAIMVTGTTTIILTKVDVLEGFDEVKVLNDGELITFDGVGHKFTKDVELGHFLSEISDILGTPFEMVSYGPRS